MKRILSLLIVVVLALSLAACGSAPAATPAAEAPAAEAPAAEAPAAEAPAGNAETIVLKMGLSHAEESPNYTACLAFADYVAEKTDGRVKIDVYASGSLGSEAELMEGLVMGTVDLAMIPPSIVASYCPVLQVFDMPFLFTDRDHVDRVLQGEIGEELTAQAEEEAGIFVYSWCEGGLRNITNNVRPINTPEDLKGLKIRVPEWEGLIKAIEAMGGIPVAMPFNEVYSACASGLVDGQETAAYTMATNAYYEVLKYYSLTGHVYTPMLFTGSKITVGALDEETQQIIRDGAKIGAELQLKLVREQEQQDLAFLEEQGMIINEIEDLTPFIELSKPVYEQFYNVIPEDLFQRIIALS